MRALRWVNTVQLTRTTERNSELSGSGATANSGQGKRMEFIRTHPRFKRGGVIPLPFNHGWAQMDTDGPTLLVP
jgi:hypothetical protein